jgi:N6-L-threonylcarbamoyladenine synthase
MSPSHVILGIETSCDETAAALVDSGTAVLSTVTHSQIETHHRYGGIVPELAGREHVLKILPVVRRAVELSGVDLHKIAGVGVSTTPGLLGALLVGVSFGKALAWSLDVPLLEVNHLEGHILSIFLSDHSPRFPFVALVVSGGHTSLYRVVDHTTFEPLGHTRDDAAGEAFDKVAKFLGLGYPGGPVIEALAREGDPRAIPFPRAWISRRSLDFSFSGLKTAVVNHLRNRHGLQRNDLGPHAPCLPRPILAEIAASFQEAVTDVLVRKTLLAAETVGCDTVVVSGGVAANGYLREAFAARAGGSKVVFPPVRLCTDNAAMIAAAAWHRLRTGKIGGLSTDARARSVSAKGRRACYNLPHVI